MKPKLLFEYVKWSPDNKKITSFLTVFFIIFLMSLVSCDKREFSVTPLPEQFGYIPPSDVSLLKATGGNQMVALHWSTPPEDNIVKIHIININNNTEKVVDGKATDDTLSNLTNLVLYNLVVKAENNIGLISQGAKISAKPFQPDVIKPSPVTNLIGFILNDGAALATWVNPVDADLSHLTVALGSDTIVVSSPINYTIIKGNIQNNIIVKAVDLSGNYSEATITSVSENMISILGSDDGVNETIALVMSPSVKIIDSYKIQWAVDKSAVIPSSTSSYTFPLADMAWLDPITVSLMSNGDVVNNYQFDHHNSLPGTIRAAYYDSKVGAINIEGDYTDIGSINDGYSATYNIMVNETNLYELTAFEANPSDIRKYEVYIDGILTGNGSVGNTGGWSNFQPFLGPTLTLIKGKHSMTIKFINGGANYQKFFFKKL
jgi:hypothetical protein